MRNVQELRAELDILWDKIDNENYDLTRAREKRVMFREMVNSARAQVEYYHKRKVSAVIDFLESVPASADPETAKVKR